MTYTCDIEYRYCVYIRINIADFYSFVIINALYLYNDLYYLR